MSEPDAGAVLDASALLAVLNDEPGADIVAKHLSAAVVSTVNLTEVASKLVDVGMPPDEARAVLSSIGLEAIAFDEDQAHLAASLRPDTRRAGLSLGDRACLALALTLGRPAVTTDRAWERVKLGVTVVLAR